MGGRGAPIICDFAPINYLLADKIPIYCLPLQYQFSDCLPDSDKWTIGQLDKCPITKRTALYNYFRYLSNPLTTLKTAEIFHWINTEFCDPKNALPNGQLTRNQRSKNPDLFL